MTLTREELEEKVKLLNKQLDERNEATKVWIQSDTQCRAYANSLLSHIEALEKENQDLREVLEFYANPENYSLNVLVDNDIGLDHGEQARACLERGKR